MLFHEKLFYCDLATEGGLLGKVGYAETALTKDFFYLVFSILEECACL